MKKIMRILTWNINGIRASKIPLKKLLDSLQADVICLQETKVAREQFDEQTAIVEGYNSYFSFSKVRSGYSGVATFVRDDFTPWNAEDRLSGIADRKSDEGSSIGCYGDHSDFTDEELAALDGEGRCVITEHMILDSSGLKRSVVLINVYCPRADPDNVERKEFKMRFYKLLQLRAEAILKSGRNVIIVGDINTTHKKIDHCEPEKDAEFYANPGRKWLDDFLCEPHQSSTESHCDEHHKFVDVLRIFFPDRLDAYTNWCSSTGARATNFGKRLDYIFADQNLGLNVFSECDIMTEVMGSDHCPVFATLNCRTLAAKKCPQLCTKYMPQFAGRQQKMSSFFVKQAKAASNEKPSSSQTSNESSQSEKVVEDAMVQVIHSKTGQFFGKRSLSTSEKQCANKKSKTVPKSTEVVKQSNMLSFLGKSNSLKQCVSTEIREGKDEKDARGENKTANSNGAVSLNFQQASESDTVLDSYQDQSSLPKKTEMELTVNSASTCPDSSEGNIASKQPSGWKHLLQGPPQAPLCKGHNEPCVLRTVKKAGPNKGRQFWTCSRPEGHKTNAQARCDYFVWIPKR